MASASPPSPPSPWAADPVRDFVAYRLIGLAIAALEVTFAAEGGEKDYRRWLKSVRRKPKAGGKAAPAAPAAEEGSVRELNVWRRPGGYAVRVKAHADRNEFMVAIEAEHFSADVMVTYDVEAGEVVAAGIERFSGDRDKAIDVARQLSELLDGSALAPERPDHASLVGLLGTGLGDDADFAFGDLDHKVQVAAIAARLAGALPGRQGEGAHPDDDHFLAATPEALWAIRDGFIELASEGENADPRLLLAWQALLEKQLEEIRFKAERRHAWAIAMIERYQADLLAMAHGPAVDINTWQALVIVLDRAKIEIRADVRAASLDLAAGEGATGIGTADIIRSMEEIVETGGGDPFRIASHLFDAMTMMPPDFANAAVMMVAEAPLPALRDVLPLVLLAPEAACRAAAAAALERMAIGKRLTPAGLRRLIALRSWLPEAERRPVDQTIRRARLAGVDCAPWPAGQVRAIQATVIDGSGCQSLVALAKDGPRLMFTGILTKQGFGVRDVIAERGLPKRDAEGMLAGVTAQVLTRTVDRDYFDRMVQHALWSGEEAGRMPPLALLEVAEVMGAAEWRAQALEPEAEVHRLLGDALRETPKPAALADALRTSAGWTALPDLAGSWFEDDERARDISLRHLRNRKKAIAALLEEVIEPRRKVWAERLVWMALWVKAGGIDAVLPSWQDFALVADALYEAMPLDQIPLMVDIARQSIERTG